MPAALLFLFLTLLAPLFYIRCVKEAFKVGVSTRLVALKTTGVVVAYLALFIAFGIVLLAFIVGPHPRTASDPMTNSDHVITIVVAMVYGILLFWIGRAIPRNWKNIGLFHD